MVALDSGAPAFGVLEWGWLGSELTAAGAPASSCLAPQKTQCCAASGICFAQPLQAFFMPATARIGRAGAWAATIPSLLPPRHPSDVGMLASLGGQAMLLHELKTQALRYVVL